MDIDTIKKAVSAESLKPELASRKAIDLIVDSAVVTEEKAAKKTAEKKPATKRPPQRNRQPKRLPKRLMIKSRLIKRNKIRILFQ